MSLGRSYSGVLRRAMLLGMAVRRSKDSLPSEVERLASRVCSAGNPGGGGNSPPSGDPGKERDRSVATKERSRSARPPRFKVILYNDDYTPMEFVVHVLEKVFGKSPSAATQIMLQIHKTGLGIGGVYVLEVAETKSATVLRMAEERGYPLRSGVEKE